MSEDAAQEKTEEPTGKRRQDFRDKGQVPKSQEVLTATGLFVGCALLWLNADLIGSTLARIMTQSYARIPTQEMDFEGAVELAGTITVSVGQLLIPIMGLLFAATLVVATLQSQGAIPKEPLKFELDKLNPISAIKEKFFSSRPLVEAGKALAKLLIVAGLVTWAAWDNAALFPALIGQEPGFVLVVFKEVTILVVTRVLPVAVVIAIADYAYESYRTYEQMKMSKEEVKEERKSSEGDPQYKAQRKRRAFEIAMGQGIRNVQKADVVITNPTHYAVALRYRKEEAPAPIVVAMGVDAWALKIRAEASRHDIPQIENRQLARLLYSQAQRGQMIPEELYSAVARVLAIIIRRRQAKTRVGISR